MVGLLVRLKLTLLRHAVSRSGWQLAGLIVGVLYAGGAVVAGVAGLAALSVTDSRLIDGVTVPVFSALTLGWTLLSLLVFGADATLDPGRFSLLPLRARQLLPGLLAATACSVGGLATIVLGLGLFAAWWAHPLAAGTVVVALPLGLATCFLLMRVVTTGLARVLAGRRFRDLAGVLVGVLVLCVAGLANALGSIVGSVGSPADLRDLAERVSAVAGWTPFGWAWALPGAAAAGDLVGLLVRLLLAVALVAALWAVWERLLDRALTEPLEAAGGTTASSSTRWERLLGTSPAGAVAARSLRYRRRDPRLYGLTLSLVLVPVVIGISAYTAADGGDPVTLLIAPVLTGALASQQVAADLAYDGTALWTHVAAGLSGADDRRGRLVAALVATAPIVVVVTAVAIPLSGRPDLAVAVVACTVATYLVGMGASLWIGSVFQGTAPPPGSDPFKSLNVGGLEGALAAFLSLGLAVAAGGVVAGLCVAGHWVPWLTWLALVLALAAGVAGLGLGIRLGGRRLDRTWPEALAKAAKAA